MTPTSRGINGTGFLLALCALAVGSMLVMPRVLEAKAVEKFTANASSTGLSGPRKSTVIDITIERWSTPEERATLYDGLRQNDGHALVATLRGLEQVGSVRTESGHEYEIHYARHIVDGERRRVLLAIDRPIGAAEMRGNPGNDDSVSIVRLDLDGEGNGDGTLVAGAELAWNEDSRSLEVTNDTRQPVRLTDVRSVD